MAALLGIVVTAHAQSLDFDAAHAAVATGDWAAAEAAIDEARARSPGHREIELLSATLAFRRGDPARAEALLRALADRDPSWPAPLNNLAAIAAAQGRLDEARDLLERALATHPDYETAYRNLGDVYARLAARAYAKALDAPDSAPAPALALIERAGPPGRCDVAPQ